MPTSKEVTPAESTLWQGKLYDVFKNQLIGDCEKTNPGKGLQLVSADFGRGILLRDENGRQKADSRGNPITDPTGFLVNTHPIFIEDSANKLAQDKEIVLLSIFAALLDTPINPENTLSLKERYEDAKKRKNSENQEERSDEEKTEDDALEKLDKIAKLHSQFNMSPLTTFFALHGDGVLLNPGCPVGDTGNIDIRRAGEKIVITTMEDGSVKYSVISNIVLQTQQEKQMPAIPLGTVSYAIVAKKDGGFEIEEDAFHIKSKALCDYISGNQEDLENPIRQFLFLKKCIDEAKEHYPAWEKSDQHDNLLINHTKAHRQEITPLQEWIDNAKELKSVFEKTWGNTRQKAFEDYYDYVNTYPVPKDYTNLNLTDIDLSDKDLSEIDLRNNPIDARTTINENTDFSGCKLTYSQIKTLSEQCTFTLARTQNNEEYYDQNPIAWLVDIKEGPAKKSLATLLFLANFIEAYKKLYNQDTVSGKNFLDSDAFKNQSIENQVQAIVEQIEKHRKKRADQAFCHALYKTTKQLRPTEVALHQTLSRELDIVDASLALYTKQSKARIPVTSNTASLVDNETPDSVTDIRDADLKKMNMTKAGEATTESDHLRRPQAHYADKSDGSSVNLGEYLFKGTLEALAEKIMAAGFPKGQNDALLLKLSAIKGKKEEELTTTADRAAHISIIDLVKDQPNSKEILDAIVLNFLKETVPEAPEAILKAYIEKFDQDFIYPVEHLLQKIPKLPVILQHFFYPLRPNCNSNATFSIAYDPKEEALKIKTSSSVDLVRPATEDEKDKSKENFTKIGTLCETASATVTFKLNQPRKEYQDQSSKEYQATNISYYFSNPQLEALLHSDATGFQYGTQRALIEDARIPGKNDHEIDACLERFDNEVRNRIATNNDLYNLNLKKLNLRDLNLENKDFSKSDLSGSDLSGSDLSGSDLSGSDLRGAQLKKANIHGVIMDDNTKLSLKELKSATWGSYKHHILDPQTGQFLAEVIVKRGIFKTYSDKAKNDPGNRESIWKSMMFELYQTQLEATLRVCRSDEKEVLLNNYKRFCAIMGKPHDLSTFDLTGDFNLTISDDTKLPKDTKKFTGSIFYEFHSQDHTTKPVKTCLSVSTQMRQKVDKATQHMRSAQHFTTALENQEPPLSVIQRTQTSGTKKEKRTLEYVKYEALCQHFLSGENKTISPDDYKILIETAEKAGKTINDAIAGLNVFNNNPLLYKGKQSIDTRIDFETLLQAQEGSPEIDCSNTIFKFSDFSGLDLSKCRFSSGSPAETNEQHVTEDDFVDVKKPTAEDKNKSGIHRAIFLETPNFSNATGLSEQSFFSKNEDPSQTRDGALKELFPNGYQGAPTPFVQDTLAAYSHSIQTAGGLTEAQICHVIENMNIDSAGVTINRSATALPDSTKLIPYTHYTSNQNSVLNIARIFSAGNKEGSAQSPTSVSNDDLSYFFANLQIKANVIQLPMKVEGKGRQHYISLEIHLSAENDITFRMIDSTGNAIAIDNPVFHEAQDAAMKMLHTQKKDIARVFGHSNTEQVPKIHCETIHTKIQPSIGDKRCGVYVMASMKSITENTLKQGSAFLNNKKNVSETLTREHDRVKNSAYLQEECKLQEPDKSNSKNTAHQALVIYIDSLANQGNFTQSILNALNEYLKRHSRGFNSLFHSEGSAYVTRALAELSKETNAEKKLALSKKIAIEILSQGLMKKKDNSEGFALKVENKRMKCLLETLNIITPNRGSQLVLLEADKSASETSDASVTSLRSSSNS